MGYTYNVQTGEGSYTGGSPLATGGGGSSYSSGGGGGGGTKVSTPPPTTTKTFYVDPSGKKWTSKEAAEARGGVSQTVTSTYSGGTKIGTTEKSGSPQVWKQVGKTGTGTPVYERTVSGKTERVATSDLTAATKGYTYEPPKTVLVGAKTSEEQKMSFAPKKEEDVFKGLEEQPQSILKKTEDVVKGTSQIFRPLAGTSSVSPKTEISEKIGLVYTGSDYVTDKKGKPIKYTSQGKTYYKTKRGETIDVRSGKLLDLTRPQTIIQKTPLMMGKPTEEEGPIFTPLIQPQSILKKPKTYTEEEAAIKRVDIGNLSKRIAEYNQKVNRFKQKGIIEVDEKERKKLEQEKDKLSAIIREQSKNTNPEMLLASVMKRETFGVAGVTEPDVIEESIAKDLNLPKEKKSIWEKIGIGEKTREQIAVLTGSIPSSPVNLLTGVIETKEQKMRRFERDIEAVQESEKKLGGFLQKQEKSFGMIPGLGLEKQKTQWVDETGKTYKTYEEAKEGAPKTIVYKTSKGEEFITLTDARTADSEGEIKKIEKIGEIIEREKPSEWKDWFTKEQWSTLGRKGLTIIGPGVAVGLPAQIGGLIKKTELAIRGLGMGETRKSTLGELGATAVKTPEVVVKSFDPRTPEGVINIGLTLFAIKSIGGARAQARATIPKVGTKPKTTNIYEVTKGNNKIIIEKGRFVNKKGETVFYETKSTVPKSGSGKGNYEITIKDSGNKVLTKQTGTFDHKVKLLEEGAGPEKVVYESKTTINPKGGRKITEVKTGEVLITKKGKGTMSEIETSIGKKTQPWGKTQYEGKTTLRVREPTKYTGVDKSKIISVKDKPLSTTDIKIVEGVIAKQKALAKQQQLSKIKTELKRFIEDKTATLKPGKLTVEQAREIAYAKPGKYTQTQVSQAQNVLRQNYLKTFEAPKTQIKVEGGNSFLNRFFKDKRGEATFGRDRGVGQYDAIAESIVKPRSQPSSIFDFKGMGNLKGAGTIKSRFPSTPGLRNFGLDIGVTNLVQPQGTFLIPPYVKTQNEYLAKYGPESEVISKYGPESEVISKYGEEVVTEPIPGPGDVSVPVPKGDTYITYEGDVGAPGSSYVENIIYGDTITPSTTRTSLGIKPYIFPFGVGGSLPTGFPRRRGGKGVGIWTVINPIKNLEKEFFEQQKLKRKLGKII